MQVGDPFTEKLLIECCLEIFAADLVVGIQDLGGAGISCATSELAAPAPAACASTSTACRCATPSLAPEEILMSESQERMCAIVEPRQVDAFLAVCAKWDVDATVIGEVTDGGRLGSSGTARPSSTCRRARWRTRARSTTARTPARPTRTRCRPTRRPPPAARPTPAELRATAAADGRLARTSPPRRGSPRQYDRYVQGNTVLAQPDDAGMVRVDEETGLGVAIATDGNGRYTRLDPYAGAQLALAEAYRNVAATGARAARGDQLPQLRLARGPRA